MCRIKTYKVCYSVKRQTKLLGLIHTDLVDLKQTMTRDGKNYFVTFIDDYSRYTKVYLMKHKDEAFDMFLSYKIEVKNQLDKKIKRIILDRGGEYVLFNDYCVKEEIIHEVTPPYSPESNGLAERKNKTPKKMMNVMLISSNALDNLWGEALLTACFLQNRIPHRKIGETPYELWKGFQPNLKYLKVWGYLAKVMLLGPKKRKISSKTSDCLFLGYAKHSVAYRFLVLNSEIIERNIIVETKNVEFFEHIFPLKVTGTSEQPINIASDTMCEDLKRSKRQRKETSYGDDFYTYLVGNEPLSFSEAINAPDAKHWDKAIKTEIGSIKKNNTCTLVDLPKGAKPISCKWIFKKKYLPDGSIEKYKARLVAKGFSQNPT